MLRADLHVHTEYSMDCATPLETVVRHCQQKGINCIAVADHGTVEGALKMQKMAPFKVIVAEEILTPYGEIMGLFLKETIPSHISPAETIARIKEQDGLVCIPHPFELVRTSALDSHIITEIVAQIDVIEVFNARNPFLHSSEKAAAFARKHGIPGSAGSDAHTPGEIGNAYVEMPDFSGKDEFLKALACGQVCGRRSSPLVHFGSMWARIQNRMNRR